MPDFPTGQLITLPEVVSTSANINTFSADAFAPVLASDEDAGQTATLSFKLLTAAEGANYGACGIVSKFPTADGTLAGVPLFSLSSSGVFRLVSLPTVPSGLARYGDLANTRDPYAAFGRLMWADYNVCVNVSDVFGSWRVSTVSVGIEALATVIPVIQTTNGPVSLVTTGNETFAFDGTGFGAAGTAAVGVYSNGRMNYTAPCTVISSTFMTCNTVPGVGTGFTWAIKIFGKQAVDLTPLIFGYAAPSVTSVTGHKDLPTIGSSGSTFIAFNGANFGPPGTLVEVTYGPSGKEGRFTCIHAANDPTSHVFVRCIPPEGAGRDLMWRITIGGQTVVPGSDSTLYISYAAPTITNVFNTTAGTNIATLSTRGGQQLTISGNNFGPQDVSIVVYVTYGGVTGNILSFKGCYKPGGAAAHTTMTCITVAGVGKDHKVNMIVEDVSATIAWPAVGSGLAYAEPIIKSVSGGGIDNMDTAGGSVISFEGSSFGPATWANIDADFIRVTYGHVGDEIRYVAANCFVVTPTEVDNVTLVIRPTTVDDYIQCTSVQGVGRGHRVALSIGGQNAPIFNANLAYAAPQIFFFTSKTSDPSNLDTRGGNDVSITGRNFGPDDAYTAGLLNVSYGVDLRNGPDSLTQVRFVPMGQCSISTAHNELTCTTSEGAAAELTWKVFLDGVESRNPSTSYHMPVVNDIMYASTRLPVSDASVDGGDMIILKGDFFGPLAYRTTGLPLIQSVTFGKTGTGYTIPRSNWTLVSPGHSEILLMLPPGAGTDLKFRVAVADQMSDPSTGTFSYARISIVSLTPSTGPTFNDEMSPTLITIKAANVPLRDPLCRIELMFGNGIYQRRLPLIIPQGPIAIAAATNADKSVNLQFSLPREGGGSDLAVRLDIVSSSAAVGSSALLSSKVTSSSLFSYRSAAISDVVLTTAHFLVNGTESNDMDTKPCPFPVGNALWKCDDPNLLQLTLIGTDFTGDAARMSIPDGVTKMLELMTRPASIFEDATWNKDALWPVSWSHNRIVVFTIMQKGVVQLTLTNVADDGRTVKQVIDKSYEERSPEISGVVGDLADIPTVGGRMVTLIVLNLNGADDVTVKVGNITAPLYQEVAGTNLLASAASRKSAIDARTAMLVSQSASLFSYNLHIMVPAGQGTIQGVIVTRTKAGVAVTSNTGYAVTYAAPSLRSFTMVLSPPAGAESRVNPEGIVSLLNPGFSVVTPTDGNAILRIRGTNLGTAPSVNIGDGYAVPATPCPGPEGIAHECVDIVIPAGEGAGADGYGYALLLNAGDQLTKQYRHLYAAPQVSLITAVDGLFPTQGGVTIIITGTNFGVTRTGSPDTQQFVQFGDGTGAILVCSNVVRVSHSVMTCTLPEGSGRMLDVAVSIANVRAVTIGKLSYDVPVVTSASIINGTTAVDAAFTNAILRGNTTGGAIVQLTGSNFGTNSTSNCAFLNWANSAGTTLKCDDTENFLGEGEVSRLYVTAWNHTHIAFTVPPGMGHKQVQLSIRGSNIAATATSASAILFRYETPVVTSLSPPLADTEGNTTMTVIGHNMGPSRIGLVLSGAGFPVNGVPLTDAPAWPTAYVVLAFHRSCITSEKDVYARRPNTVAKVWYSTSAAGVAIDTCSDSVISQDHSSIQFMGAPGIGKNRQIIVYVVDDKVGIIESSAPVTFSYEAPQVQAFSPSVVYMAGETESLDVLGRHFGNEELAVVQGWTADEKAVSAVVGGITCQNPKRKRENGETVLMCDVDQLKMASGYRNITVRVAGQMGSKDATPSGRTLLFVCAPGYYAHVNETCIACPAQNDDPARRGAVCRGYVTTIANFESRFTYPRPLKGWYNLNSSDAYTRKVEGSPSMMGACPAGFQDAGRDVCIVPCDPQDSCLGDNLCAEGYTSLAPMYRCAYCDKGFYKRSGECVKCPDSPAALFIGFILLVVAVAGGGFLLNKKQINIAVISIGVDFFQVLAIFGQARIKWPLVIKELLHVLSAFNLNIEIVAPECLIPDVSYKQKFWFIMLLPLCIGAMFAAVYVSLGLYKAFILGQSKSKSWDHSQTLVSSCLVLLYLLYLYLTRTIFDVFNCAPTFPPDGKEYLSVVFEECGLKGGTQLTLMPFAIAGLAVYTAGYPVYIGYMLWKNKEIVMEDQLLRAKGTGGDKLSNPRAFDFRSTYGRSYFQFKPDFCLWILAIIARKFFIAITAVVFGKNSSFQMAACLLIMFLSYAAQVQIRPYMSAGDFEEVLKSHADASYASAIHARLRASLAGIETRGRKKGHKNLINFEGKVDRNAVLGVLTGFFFNYNTVEAIMQFCAVIVCLMAIMYQANELSSYYPQSKDSVTAVVLIVIIWAIVYFFTVFVTEIVVLYNEDNRSKQLAKSARGARNGEGKKGASGDDADSKSRRAARAVSQDEVVVGNVQSTSNPMFINAGGKDGAQASLISGIGDSAVQALMSMNEPPPMELWRLFQTTFTDLAGQLKDAQTRINEQSRQIQQTASTEAVVDVESAGQSRKKREFGPKATAGQGASKNPIGAASSRGLSLSAARAGVNTRMAKNEEAE